MSHYHELRLKDNPFLWAREEFQHDRSYWLDRAKNGNGLIQEIALFVLKNGQLEPERGCATFLMEIRFSDIERSLGLDFADSLLKNPKAIMEKLNQHLKNIVLPIDDEFRPMIGIVDFSVNRFSVQDARKKD